MTLKASKIRGNIRPNQFDLEKKNSAVARVAIQLLIFPIFHQLKLSIAKVQLIQSFYISKIYIRWWQCMHDKSSKCIEFACTLYSIYLTGHHLNPEVLLGNASWKWELDENFRRLNSSMCEVSWFDRRLSSHKIWKLCACAVGDSDAGNASGQCTCAQFPYLVHRSLHR